MIERAFWNFASLEGLRADDRLRVLSRAAAAVLFRLVLVSRGDDVVPYLIHRSGLASIAAYDLRASDLEHRDEAGDAVLELIDAGVIALDDEARVVRLRLASGALARAPEPSASEEVQTPVSSTSRRRTPPSSTPERARDRKLRHQFNHRAGPFRTMLIPAEMTWETWSASAEGRAFLTRNDPGTTPERGWNDPENDPRNEAGTTQNDPGTTLPPTPPFRKGTEENLRGNNTDNASARETGTTRNENGNDPRNENGNEVGNDPGTTPGLVPGSGAVAPLSLIPAKTTSKKPTDVEKVFAHWQKECDHPRAVLDGKRRGLIQRALKTWSADDLCMAVSGYGASAWHRGANDRNARYDGLDLILRDAAHIERGIEMFGAREAAQEDAGDDDVFAKGLRALKAEMKARRQADAREVAHG